MLPNNPGNGGFDLGQAAGRIVISFDDSSLQQAQRQFDSALQSMGAGLSKLGGQISGLGSSLTVLTAPIAAFGATGVNAAARFEDALREIEVRAGLTADQMEQVKQKALDIGRDTQFSAGQGAEAFLQLLTSGQSVAEAFQTVDAVIQGAAASGEQLGFVSDSITDIMAAFQLQADRSASVVQDLADAAGASSATFGDLVAGFQNVGGVASQFGLSVRDTAGILALFSENGIKGSEAGTQLRSMLNNMARPTDKVQNLWKKLGISMFDVTGQARPLGDVLDDLRVKFADMNDQTRIETIQTLAGTYGQLGLTALTTGGSLDQMQDAMDQGADAADIAAARMDTFSGAIAFLRGSVETFQINTLTPFMNDVLRPLVKHIADVVNQLNEWATANPELANKIIALMAGLVAAGPTLFAVGKAISFVGTAFSTLGTILAVVTSPIGLIAAAIAGVAVALDALGIINLGEIFDTIRTAVERFVGALQGGVSFFDAFITLLGDLFGTGFAGWFVETLRNIVNFINNEVLPRLNDLWTWFTQSALPAIVDFVTNTALPAVQDFLDTLEGAWIFVSASLGQLYDWFVTNALPEINKAILKVQLIWNGLKNALTALWNTAKPFLQPIIDWFRNTFQYIGEHYIKPVIDFINDIIQKASDALEMLRQLGGGVPNMPEHSAYLGNVDYRKPYQRDNGGPGMADIPYLVGTGAQPELVVPRTNVDFIPNADKLMGGDTIGPIYIQASTYEGGVAAAEGLNERLRQLRRKAG